MTAARRELEAIERSEILLGVLRNLVLKYGSDDVRRVAERSAVDRNIRPRGRASGHGRLHLQQPAACAVQSAAEAIMSRSGYSDDCEYLELYRGAVDRALFGKRGQAFLRELAEALDAMPEKALITNELISQDGGFCAIGVVCKARALDVSTIDYDDADVVAKAIGIASSMAREIAFLNDEEGTSNETPAQRWTRMRKWVDANLATRMKHDR